MGAGARFRAFEFDRRRCELRRHGARVHVQELPLRLLEQLLARPGELVSRHELRFALWPGKEFGDFERGLNTAMRKLREALSDDADHPEFIETVPRRGYRWIGPLEASAEPLAPTNAPPKRHGRWGWLAAAGMAAAALLWYRSPLPPPHIVRIAQVTTRARIDTPVRPVSDGERVFYTERNGDHWDLMQTAIAGGEPQKLQAPGPSATVLDASLRSAQLLLGSFVGRDQGERLWTMPLQGGAAVEVSPQLTGGAVFSPDGRHIAYILGDQIGLMDADGGQAHTLLRLPDGAGWLAWSPDGSRLRFTMAYHGASAIWEVRITGQGLHVLSALNGNGRDACCGAWTPGGRYYVFTATRDGHSNLWALREHGAWWRRSPRGPFQLTHGPDDPQDGTPAMNGDRVLFFNGVFHSEAVRVNPVSGAVTPADHPLPLDGSYSRDGAWIAFPDPDSGALIRSRPDGSDRLELAGADVHPGFPRFSPDGRVLAFTGGKSGQPSDVFIIASDGSSRGVPQPLPPLGELGDVDWRPGGHRLVYSRAPNPRQPQARALEIFDLAASRKWGAVVPGSQGLIAPRWSYDGHFLAATTFDQHQLKLFDAARQRWRVLGQGNAFGFAEWSPDSRYVYFQDLLGPGQRILRYDTRSHHTAVAADFTATLYDNVYRCALYGVAPDGSLLVRYDRGGLDLFAATMDWP